MMIFTKKGTKVGSEQFYHRVMFQINQAIKTKSAYTRQQDYISGKDALVVPLSLLGIEHNFNPEVPYICCSQKNIFLVPSSSLVLNLSFMTSPKNILCSSDFLGLLFSQHIIHDKFNGSIVLEQPMQCKFALLDM